MGESINDRNDRAIRKAALWYQDHRNIKSVLLSDDVANREKSIAKGILAFSCNYFI